MRTSSRIPSMLKLRNGTTDGDQILRGGGRDRGLKPDTAPSQCYPYVEAL